MDREEKILREYVRRKIGATINEHKVAQRKIIKEEQRLRIIIRELLKEGDISDMHPHRSTGINVLEDVLKKMITTLRTDYKRMTTNKNQRDSFRANLLDAVSKLLAAEDVNVEAGTDMEMDVPLEEIDIKIDDEEESTPDDMFIDIDADQGIPEEEEEAFGIEGQEETGRNMAAKSYDKIEKNIIDSYAILSDDKDRKTFRDYLITNIKMYFDKYEAEMSTEVVEPTTDEYEKEKNDQDAEATPAEDTFDSGEGTIDFDT